MIRANPLELMLGALRLKWMSRRAGRGHRAADLARRESQISKPEALQNTPLASYPDVEWYSGANASPSTIPQI